MMTNIDFIYWIAYNNHLVLFSRIMFYNFQRTNLIFKLLKCIMLCNMLVEILMYADPIKHASSTDIYPETYFKSCYDIYQLHT